MEKIGSMFNKIMWIIIVVIFLIVLVVIFAFTKSNILQKNKNNEIKSNNVISKEKENNQEISDEIKNIEGLLEEKLYDEPTIYSKDVINEYVRWKYGNDWKISEENTKKIGEDDIIYMYKRNENNDYFYIYTYSEEDQIAVTGGLLEGTGKYKKVLLDFYAYDIALSHLDEIKELAEEKKLEIKVDTINNNIQRSCNISLKINSGSQIEDVADFMLELDEILQYSQREETKGPSLKIDVSFNNKQELVVPKNDNDREKYTRSYYIDQLQNIL